MSIRTRTGRRCTTFTQLPDEFSAGNREKFWSVAGATLCTMPSQVGPG